MNGEKYDLDLGHGHTLRWTSWAPDRDLNPQFDGIPDVERFGAVITHPRTDGGTCSSGVVFDGEVQRRLKPVGLDGRVVGATHVVAIRAVPSL